MAAIAAALLALGVIVVPAVTGNDEAASTTPTQPPTTTPPPTGSSTTTSTTTPTSTTTTTEPTTTTAPASTTTPTSTGPTSTTKTTTIHLTTTNPTTTPATTPPAGSVLLVRARVQADGTATQTVNRGQEAVVRRTATGRYRIRFPGMSDASRQRSSVSVGAGPATAAVAGWGPDGALDVLLFDRKTGEPVSHRFTFGVSVPTLPPTR